MFELPWFSLFVFGTLFGWLVILAWFVLISLCLYNDNYHATIGFSILAFVSMALFGDLVPIVKATEFTLGLILKWLVMYVGCGVVWGLFKYLVLFTSEIKEKYNDTKRAWLKKNGISGNEVPADMKASFADYLVKNTNFHNGMYGEQRRVQVKPDAWEHKADITAWMTFWMFSLAETVLGDLLRIVFRRIQTMLGNMMNAATDWMFRHIEKDWKD